MNVLLRAFGIGPLDRGELITHTCPTCGQKVGENWIVRPLSALEQAVADYQSDRIDAATLERRVAAAVGEKGRRTTSRTSRPGATGSEPVML